MRLIFLGISAACLFGPNLALAQAMSDAELLEMFNKQRDAYTDARNTGTGKTRGLSIVTVEPDAGTAAVDTPQVDPGTTITHGQLEEGLQINVRIEFDFDSAALAQAQKQKLTQLCTVMKASDIGLFRIIGHTDATGSEEYNERLSLLRAQEVKRYFTSDCGMATTRLEAVGFGERFLFNSAQPDAGENRRVEFQALS
jgi:outer membrane protein OmpA-like peptidoglycan-associated protein